MNRLFIFFIYSALSILLSSCSTYYFTYDTYLEKSNPHSLQYQDSLFTFIFKPVSNGIYFKIDNLTKRPVYILWDNCYFILPNGNSSKALNVDLLSMTSEVLIKEKSESIVPPNSSYARFTNSNINLNLVETEHLITINNYFTTQNNTYSFSTYSKYATYGSYWPTELPNVVSLDDYLPEIQNYIRDNDNLGIGFSLRLDSQIYEYRFNFKFENVDVYVKASDWSTMKTHRVMTASKNKLWKWEDIE